jgi:type VI secretion system protein ImpJ
MGNDQRTLWDEGMLLSPQHFQQSDRYHDAVLTERVRLQQPHEWGVAELRFDEAALTGGEIALQRVVGVTKDGTYFSAPDRDPLPAPRALGAVFPPQQASLGVYVAIPTRRAGAPVCGDDEAATDAPTPLRRRSLVVADEVRPTTSELEVMTAVVNVRLLFDGETLDDHHLLKVADVVRKDTGGYALSTEFVPACLHVATSPRLHGELRALIEVLGQRSADLAGRQRGGSGMAEAASLWLQHTINSHLPGLLHDYHVGRVHPERTFLQVASLAGGLCTFAGQTHPRDLPRYAHADGASFLSIVARARELLEQVIPNRCRPLPLTKRSEILFDAQLPDGTLLQDAEFYLAVGADLHEERIQVEFPRKAKISSRDRVQDLLVRMVPGLAIKHVASPPPEIPVQPGRQYFRLQKSGEHWEAIAQSRSFAFHVPPEFPGLRLELMAVQE